MEFELNYIGMMKEECKQFLLLWIELGHFPFK